MSDQFLEGASIENQHRAPFYMIDNRVHDEWIVRIGAYAYLVYSSLVRRADSSGSCFPSQNRVAQDLGISSKTVSRALAVLEEHCLIARTPRYKRDTRERTSDKIVILPLPLAGTQVVTGVPEVGTHSPYVGTHSPGGMDSQSVGGDSQSEEEDVLTRPREVDTEQAPKKPTLIPPPPANPEAGKPLPWWEVDPDNPPQLITNDVPNLPHDQHHPSGDTVRATRTGGDPLPKKTFTPKEVDPLGRKRTGKSDPHMVVFWWEDKTGVGIPGPSFSRALKSAKDLFESGVTSITELEELYDFGSWRMTKGGSVSLGDMVFDVVKWRASKVAPKPKEDPEEARKRQDKAVWDRFV